MKKTNAQLIKELRETANFVRFGTGRRVAYQGDDLKVEVFVRNETQFYREAWVNPLIDDIAERLGVRREYEVWLPPMTIPPENVGEKSSVLSPCPVGTVFADDIEDARAKARQDFPSQIGDKDFAVFLKD